MTISESNQLLFGIAVSAVTLLVVAACVIAVLLYLRRTGKFVSADHSSEIDEGTGLGNRYYLARRYRDIAPDKRSEYALVCVYAESEKIERNLGRDKMLDYVNCVANQLGLNSNLSIHEAIARIPGDGLFLLLKKNGMLLRNNAENHKPENNNTENHESVNNNDENHKPVNKLEEIIKKTVRYNKDDNLFEFVDKKEDESSPTLGETDYRLSAGIYNFKESDDDIHRCIFNACQTSKAAYSENMVVKTCDEETLELFASEMQKREDILHAFENREFVTYIQFFVDARDDSNDKKIVGGEALIRWKKPGEENNVMPMSFIPFMEKEDMISKLDYYNLEEVCKFLEKAYRNNITDFYLSCNFSRMTFSSVDFVVTCEKIFNKGNDGGPFTFPKSMIAFEMTESAKVMNPEQTLKNTEALSKLGIKILLDDFGEGFANLYDLTNYNVSGLKLDKALVDKITTVDKNYIVIDGMTKIGHKLNMTVIVEGVESTDQVEKIENANCDVIQGFLYHKPIANDVAWEALAKSRNIQTA